MRSDIATPEFTKAIVLNAKKFKPGDNVVLTNYEPSPIMKVVGVGENPQTSATRVVCIYFGETGQIFEAGFTEDLLEFWNE